MKCKLFTSKEDFGIEKICSGNNKIKFFDINLNSRVFYPGDSFPISMKYESLVDYKEVDIDIAILSSNESAFYFQATNKAYNKIIDLEKGEHTLNIKIENIQINNAMAKIIIATNVCRYPPWPLRQLAD